MTGRLKYESFARQVSLHKRTCGGTCAVRITVLDLERAAMDLTCPTCGAHLCETFTREVAVALRAALADDADDGFAARVARIARWFVS